MDRPETASEKQQQALRDLDALRHDRDLLHGLWHRSSAWAAGHFSGADAGTSDPIEIWGRRIGRALAAFAFAALCLYLYVAYVR